MISFYSENLIDQATISASTENLLFPKENLKDYRRTKVFRSNSNADSVVFDFLETSEVNSILLVDEPRNGFGFSTVTLQLNGTNEWSSPAFTQVLTVNQSHGFAYAEFTTQEYRFARIVMTSTLGFCELSKVFIGKSITFQSGMGIDLGWSYQDRELGTEKENRYGQKFVDLITRRKQLSFSLSAMNKDELDQVLEIYDNKGTSRPFWMRLGHDEMINDKDRFAGFFFMKDIPAIVNRAFGLYDMSMTIEEGL